MEQCTQYNIGKWIKENEKHFIPPVCNKMMFGQGQMKAFFIGGPNQRKDYHVECGEELFYQRKGDMELKVVEKGLHRTIPIKEGQIFLLPARVMHSPQRFKDTLGFVMERERATNEKDGLRYFVEKDGNFTSDILYESWFHCTDLGTQLGPIIKTYFASEQHKTGNPIKGDHLLEEIPLKVNDQVSLMRPFSLKDWIEKNKKETNTSGQKRIFDSDFQFQVFVYGKGENNDQCEHAETIILQIEGKSKVTVNAKLFDVESDNILLVPKNQRFIVKQEEGSLSLVVYQDPSKCSTWKNEM